MTELPASGVLKLYDSRGAWQQAGSEADGWIVCIN